MTIEEIRNCFSRAHVLISNTGITVLYSYGKEWFEQSVNAGILAELVEKSNSVTFSSDGKSFTKIFFSAQTGITGNLMFVSTYKEPSLDEIKLTCAEHGNGKINLQDYLIELSNDSSEDEVADAFMSFLNDMEEFEPDVQHYPVSWEQLEQLAQEFSDLIDGEIDISRPDDKQVGVATIYVENLSKLNLLIEGETKSVFEECLCNCSTIMSIEGNSSSDILNIIFFE